LAFLNHPADVLNRFDGQSPQTCIESHDSTPAGFAIKERALRNPSIQLRISWDDGRSFHGMTAGRFTG